MQKEAKSVDAHAVCDSFMPRTVNVPRSDGDVRNSNPPVILGDDFLLFYLRKAVCIAPESSVPFNWTRFVQQSPPRVLLVGINCEGTDVDKTPQAIVLHASFEKISCGDNRVHERVRE